MRQQCFIDTLNAFDAWQDRFNYLIELGDLLPLETPPQLLPFRIHSCQSRTYFRAWAEDGLLRVDGWSNTPVQRGIIASIIDMFDRAPLSGPTSESDIYFHEKSGLIYNLPPLRAAGLKEMLQRIKRMR
jgi:cysteine desulfuration protein SufE